MLKITICMEQTISQSLSNQRRGQRQGRLFERMPNGLGQKAIAAVWWRLLPANHEWRSCDLREKDSSWECVRWPINSWRPWNTSYTLFILAYIRYRHMSVNHTTCHVSLPILLWKGNRKSTLPANSIPPQYGICTSWEGPPYGDLWPRTCRLL